MAGLGVCGSGGHAVCTHSSRSTTTRGWARRLCFRVLVGNLRFFLLRRRQHPTIAGQRGSIDWDTLRASMDSCELKVIIPRDFNVLVASAPPPDYTELDVLAVVNGPACSPTGTHSFVTDFAGLGLCSKWPLQLEGSSKLRLGGAAMWALVQGPTCVASVVLVRIRDVLEYSELLERVLSQAFSDASHMHLLIGEFGGLDEEDVEEVLRRLDVFQPPAPNIPLPHFGRPRSFRACVGSAGRSPVWCYSHVEGGVELRSRRRWRSCARRRRPPPPSLLLGCKV